jgi:hypothetical protein
MLPLNESAENVSRMQDRMQVRSMHRYESNPRNQSMRRNIFIAISYVLQRIARVALTLRRNNQCAGSTWTRQLLGKIADMRKEAHRYAESIH